MHNYLHSTFLSFAQFFTSCLPSNHPLLPEVNDGH